MIKNKFILTKLMSFFYCKVFKFFKLDLSQVNIIFLNLQVPFYIGFFF